MNQVYLPMVRFLFEDSCNCQFSIKNLVRSINQLCIRRVYNRARLLQSLVFLLKQTRTRQAFCSVCSTKRKAWKRLHNYPRKPGIFSVASHTVTVKFVMPHQPPHQYQRRVSLAVRVLKHCNYIGTLTVKLGELNPLRDYQVRSIISFESAKLRLL